MLERRIDRRNLIKVRAREIEMKDNVVTEIVKMENDFLIEYALEDVRYKKRKRETNAKDEHS